MSIAEQNALSRRAGTSRPNRGPAVRSESMALFARDPSCSGAHRSSAMQRLRRRCAWCPRIIGDVDDHRVRAGLRRRAVVVAQAAAKTFATRDRRSGIGVVVGRRRDCGDQSVVEALVIALDGSARRIPRSRSGGGAHRVGRACRGTQIFVESTKRSATEFRLGL